MYNLLEYSNNYSMTSGSLLNSYRDKVNDDVNEFNADNYRIDNSKTVTSRSFEYKTKIIGSTPTDKNTLDTEVVVPLKYLNNLWMSLDLPLANCEIVLDLSRSKDCVIYGILRAPEIATNPDVDVLIAGRPATEATNVTFQINSTKLYVSVVTLSINGNIKFLENLK